MFIFQGAKTKSRVSPTIVAGKGSLRIGSKEYNSEQLKASRAEIIDWLMTNKKHNVAKMYINEGSSTLEKSMNGKYNKWLIDNSIVYTDAVATTKNKSAFIQPTLRYSAAKTEEKAAPAKKESVKPNQVKRTNLANLTGGFQAGLTSKDLANLGIELPSQEDAFNIDADFGAPTPTQKSDITKSQEDQNCK